MYQHMTRAIIHVGKKISWRSQSTDTFPADFVEGWGGGDVEVYAEKRLEGRSRSCTKALQEVYLQVCCLRAVCVCLSASTPGTYGRSLWSTRHRVHFYPLSFIVAIHFSPSCQPPSTQLLLPWRHLMSWHMNQPPPQRPSITNSILLLSSHMSSPLRSVTVHPVRPFLRTSSYPQVTGGSDSVHSSGAWRCQTACWSSTCDSRSQRGLWSRSRVNTPQFKQSVIISRRKTLQSMKDTAEREAILQMPGPFGSPARSGPLNWHLDWTHAGQKVRPVTTGNKFDGLCSKDGISPLGETDVMT